MRIEREESRYFILKILQVSGKLNTRIDKDLFREIPMFLKYLSQLPPIDFTLDRLILTKEQTHTPHLLAIKNESKTWLHKELEIAITKWFAEHEYSKEFKANLSEIRTTLLSGDRDAKVNFIKKTLLNEMKIPFCENEYYFEFDNESNMHNGATFHFLRKNFTYLKIKI